MISNTLNEVSTRAHQRYLALIEQLRGLYHRSLMMKEFGTPALLGYIDREAEAAMLWFLREEAERINLDMQKIAEIARRATIEEIASIDASELTDAALEHLNASVDYLYSEIVAQVSRDIATLKRTLQRASLEVSVAARSRGLSHRSAVMEFIIGNKSDVEFAFHDRASRKWASSAFIRSVWRQTALSVYNEMVLFTLADHGLRIAQVESDTAGAAHHGMIVALSSNADMPTYSEIRDTIFHPNSNAYLKTAELADVHA